MEKRHKLGVIVPYRNRAKDLVSFKSCVPYYLENKEIDYKIFIIKQDDAKQFNRGMLLNIGFNYALKHKCDYVVFHDVDMLPLEVDYSYSDKPIHMATDFISKFGEEKRDIFDQYFGGVTMFSVEDFIKINGYSNKYWGWGYEDDDLLLRCVKKGLDLDTLKLKNNGRDGKSLLFNGVNSLVKCENTIDLNLNATFFISFNPDKLILDHTKQSDEFTIFSIPGWDFAVCYNSFHRYNFCAFDTQKNALYVNSKIKPNYKTNITVVLDNDEKILKVYQDGEFIGETPTFKKLHFYRKEPYFYLGVGKPDRENMENYFKGTFDIFAYFDEKLSEEDIRRISNNEKEHFQNTFNDKKLIQSLKIYYNSDYIKNYELIDLSGNKNNGVIENCQIIKNEYSEFTEVKIPHRRRSVFDSLIHESNGFLNNKWKDQATRWNQLRFVNEVSLNDELLENDGLSNLEFIEHGIITEKNIYQITVGI